jgi:hypothetical protein
MFDKLLIALISPLGGGIVLFSCALLLGWQKRGRLASFLGCKLGSDPDCFECAGSLWAPCLLLGCVKAPDDCLDKSKRK